MVDQTQDRRAWLRDNLPTVAAIVDDFAAAFGRGNIRVAYASEAGHRFGQPSPGEESRQQHAGHPQEVRA